MKSNLMILWIKLINLKINKMKIRFYLMLKKLVNYYNIFFMILSI